VENAAGFSTAAQRRPAGRRRKIAARVFHPTRLPRDAEESENQENLPDTDPDQAEREEGEQSAWMGNAAQSSTK